MRSPLPAAILLTSLAAQNPVPATTGFLAATIEVDGRSHPYVVYLPRDYTPERRWPLLVFLHGMGECGTDGWKHVAVGLGPAIQLAAARWPFVVVFPQKPDKPSQWEDHEAMVMAIADRAVRDYAIDPARQYLTGLSQGGHGTWVLGGRHASRWAAIAPICGYGDPKAIAPGVKDLPIWAFHGTDDRVVPPGETRNLAAAVAKAGGRVETTYFARTAHNSWDQAYRDQPLAEWLLASAETRAVLCALADADSIERVEVTILRASSSDGGPGMARQRNTLRGGKHGAEWRSEALPAKADAPPPTTPPRHGELGADAGNQAVLKQLKALLDGGVFDLPASLTPQISGSLMAAVEHTVEVAVTRNGMRWTFQRTLPPGTDLDPRYRREAGAIAASFAAIERMP